MKKQLIILLTIFAFGSVNAQRIYKWTDENGTVHYSSTKPANDDNVEALRLKPPKTVKKQKAREADAADSETTEAKADKETKQSPKEKRKARQQKAAVDAKEKQRKCSMARKNLASLSSSTRVATKGEDGERRMLSDKERVDAFKNANQVIKQNCQ